VCAARSSSCVACPMLCVRQCGTLRDQSERQGVGGHSPPVPACALQACTPWSARPTLDPGGLGKSKRDRQSGREEHHLSGTCRPWLRTGSIPGSSCRSWACQQPHTEGDGRLDTCRELQPHTAVSLNCRGPRVGWCAAQERMTSPCRKKYSTMPGGAPTAAPACWPVGMHPTLDPTITACVMASGHAPNPRPNHHRLRDGQWACTQPSTQPSPPA